MYFRCTLACLVLSAFTVLHAQDTVPAYHPDAGAIGYNFFKPQQQIILAGDGDDFDSLAALKALFPGHFYSMYDNDEANMVMWVCDSCPQVALDAKSFINEESGVVTLPKTWANYTSVIGTLAYRDAGLSYRAVFFSTCDEYPGSGRFSPGILGMAIFQQNPGDWYLQAFSPAVAAEGGFMSASPPQKVIKTAGQTFFILDGGNANGAGAAYLYFDQYIFGLKNGVPVELLHDFDATCEAYEETLTHWKTELQVSSSKAQFPDVDLVTTGNFDSTDQDERQWWENLSWWKALQEFLAGKPKTTFKMIRHYHYEGGAYALKETRFEE